MFIVEILSNVQNIMKKIKNHVVSLSCFFLWAKAMPLKVRSVDARYQDHLKLIFKNMDSETPSQTYKSRIPEGLSSECCYAASRDSSQPWTWENSFRDVSCSPQTQKLQDLGKYWKFLLDVHFVSRSLKWNLRCISNTAYSVLKCTKFN